MKPTDRIFLGLLLANPIALICIVVLALVLVSLAQLAIWYVGFPLLAGFLIFQLVKKSFAKPRPPVFQGPLVEIRQQRQLPDQALLEAQKGPQRW
jgi:hypothetical protein